MSKIKIVCILVSLFILTTGAILVKKGLLTRENISYLIKKSSPDKSIKKEESLPEEKEIALALQKIEEEKEKLFKEKEEMGKFKEHLSMQEEELKNRTNEIISLKKEAEMWIEKKEEGEKEEVNWLSKVYERMRAEEAAPIIEKLDENLAIAVLSKMEERQAGKILGAMDSKQAIKLSQKIGKPR